MKTTTILKSACMALLAGCIASCDVLDVSPLDSYTEENIFNDAKLTEAYVTYNYVLPRNGWSRSSLRYACDESMENFNWGNIHQVNKGGLTPDQFGGLDIWSSYYSNIKNINIFFNNIDKVNTIDDPDRSYLIGEATFFRAYYYMELINNYGGVPLITRTFELDDPEMMVTRDSYQTCADFVISEFQKAADLLPTKFTGSDFGRATKGAALAMKARMQLYAASPLWNTTNDVNKWREAAKTCEEVMALGYSLDPDYAGLFHNPQSPEIIFQRLYNTEFGHWYDGYNSTNGFQGWSCTVIPQEMVDSYELEDGTMPTADIYANATSDPWAGRDPRLYASIVCDGQQFRGREVEFWVNEDGTKGGLDSEFGIQSWNYSKSHYIIRKFMDENLSLPMFSERGKQPWIYCRLAEIYLNYAEAKFHMGDEQVARDYVNKIRQRARGGKAGILPDVTESGDALLAKIQHERKIELAFEEHRFYDVRRWKIAEQTDNGMLHGIKIVKHDDGTKSYKFYDLQERAFVAPANYLLPIPNYERRKNDLLEQNPGYNSDAN